MSRAAEILLGTQLLFCIGCALYNMWKNRGTDREDGISDCIMHGMAGWMFALTICMAIWIVILGFVMIFYGIPQ